MTNQISSRSKFLKPVNISNNLNIALKYNLDGLYLPSFNKILKYKIYSNTEDIKYIQDDNKILYSTFNGLYRKIDNMEIKTYFLLTLLYGINIYIIRKF